MSVSAEQALELWSVAWPERLPHPRGLVARWHPEHVLAEMDGGQVVGLVAYAPPGDHPHGHVRLLLVHPEYRGRGIGTALLERAEDRLRHLGAAFVALGEERGHFFPGAPEEVWPSFERRGYRPTGAVSTDLARNLADLPAPAPLPAGWRVTTGAEVDVLPAALDFVAATFSPRWRHDAGLVAPPQVFALLHGDRVRGFALIGSEADPAVLPSFLWPRALARHATGDPDAPTGGLGPMGIDPEARGQGLGLALLHHAAWHLRGRGVRAMGIDWTGISPFYERLGFRPWLRHRHARKAL